MLREGPVGISGLARAASLAGGASLGGWSLPASVHCRVTRAGRAAGGGGCCAVRDSDDDDEDSEEDDDSNTGMPREEDDCAKPCSPGAALVMAHIFCFAATATAFSTYAALLAGAAGPSPPPPPAGFAAANSAFL